MPTYDYGCAACGHRFERFESIHGTGLKACEKCGKKKAKRLLGTGAGLIFKGSGFYVTDYKKKSGAGGAEESKPSDAGAKSSGEKKDKKDKEPKK